MTSDSGRLPDSAPALPDHRRRGCRTTRSAVESVGGPATWLDGGDRTHISGSPVTDAQPLETGSSSSSTPSTFGGLAPSTLTRLSGSRYVTVHVVADTPSTDNRGPTAEAGDVVAAMRSNAIGLAPRRERPAVRETHTGAPWTAPARREVGIERDRCWPRRYVPLGRRSAFAARYHSPDAPVEYRLSGAGGGDSGRDGGFGPGGRQ